MQNNSLRPPQSTSDVSKASTGGQWVRTLHMVSLKFELEMALLPADEKQIRRRLQCKMNMRSHRDRRKRSAQLLEASIAQLQREIDLAQEKLTLYRSLTSRTDVPMAIVHEYNQLFSHRRCGDPQVQFLRTHFAPTFTNNGQPLEVFIAMWFKMATYYALPDNILSLHALSHERIELRVLLETPITYDLLANCYPFVLEQEDPATIAALVDAQLTMTHVLTRYFYFATDFDGRWIVTHSTVFDDRYVQMAQFVALARRRRPLALM